MATLKIYLDTRAKRQDGTYPLKLAVNHHGDTAFVPLNQFIKKEYWDRKSQKVIVTPEKDALNSYLLDRMFTYNNALRSVLSSPGYTQRVTAQELRELIVDIVDPVKVSPTTFKDVFDKFLVSHENPRTRDIYKATWIKIRAFDSNASELTFEQINREWLDRFFAWMAEKSPSVNARNIHMRNIRSVFNYAIDDEVTTCYPFRRVKIRPVETAKRNLTPMQLRMIFDAPVEEWAQKYIDMFKLSFLLIGINIGDMLTLPSDCIHNGRIEYNRKKTHRLYSVKLEPEALAIIKKYPSAIRLTNWMDSYSSYHDLAARLNRALRRIMPGVTTYYARHSWATIAASLDIPKETIAQALGHAQNTVTDVYIQFDRRKVDAANRRVIDYVLYGKQ